MILYNVTVKIDHGTHADWLEWMRAVHVPAVMATGFFTKNLMVRLLEPPPDEEGVTYALQYFAKDLDALRRYQAEAAPALQAEHRERYEGRFVAFRTVMEVVG